MNFDVPYAITKRLPATTIAAARPKVEAALKAEGFGVLTEIDVQATLKKKLDIDFSPYVILGACNPTLAHEALRKTPSLGLLLPCNIVLAQEGDDVILSAASPKAMFSAMSDGAAEALAERAEEKIRRAVNAV